MTRARWPRPPQPRLRAPAAALLAVAAAILTGAPQARAAPAARSARNQVQPVAPSRPPLLSGGSAPSGEASAGGDSSARQEGPPEQDPLVGNGLASPSCGTASLLGGLSARGRENCAGSGFAAAPAPTGDYGLDVHIDTGFAGLTTGGLLSAVQDLVIQPLWMALVWAVHALVVMLEWAFSLNLLGGALGGGIGAALGHLQGAAVAPWMALAMSVAAVLAAYEGLVRRRVADALGNALVMFAMMAGAGWLVADPQGTIGVLSSWSDQAALGTLGAAAGGASGGAALSGGMEAVYTGAVEAPWCYLEFGDVGWCNSPRRMDGQLRAAARGVAARLQARVGCTPSAEEGGATPAGCAPRGSAGARSLEHSAWMLRSGATNGELFLALPSNGMARNSINEGWSLLHAICRSSDATHCSGPSAAPAEFRTDGGTWPRLGGLLLIGAGLLGMLLLLGFIAVRLLTAAVFSVLYLLAAPVMMLAPAFGEPGRAVFRRWGALLLSAVAAKLIFAFALGLVLAVASAIRALPLLGWWAQWLLMSAFWWSLFIKRAQLLSHPGAVLAAGRPGGGRSRADRLATRSAGGAVRHVKARQAARAASRMDQGGSGPGQGGNSGPAGLAGPGSDRQAEAMVAFARRGAEGLALTTPAGRAALAAERARLGRLGEEKEKAAQAGDRRREVSLGARAQRLAASIEADHERQEAAAGDLGGDAGSADRLASASRALDEQAALPPRGRPSPEGRRRDYAGLAPLAGLQPAEYEALDEPRARRARLEIDRALAERGAGRHGPNQGLRAAAGEGEQSAWAEGASSLAGHAGTSVQGARHRRPPGARTGAAAPDAAPHVSPADARTPVRAPGAPLPGRRGTAERGTAERGAAEGAPEDNSGLPPLSPILLDIRAVNEGRKRQLGIGKP